MEVKESNFDDELEPTRQSNESESNSPSIKSNLRSSSLSTGRYIKSLVILFIAITISWWSMNIGPTNENHFSGGSEVLSWSWFIHSMEENPILKLNVINTNFEPLKLRSQSSFLKIDFYNSLEEERQQELIADYSVAVSPQGQLFLSSIDERTPLSSEPYSSNVIYFDYDRSSINPDESSKLDDIAKFLVGNPNESVLIEGHTSEYRFSPSEKSEVGSNKHTPEYAIALGERLAKSVVRYLENLGVSPAQMSVVSYGLEKPDILSNSVVEGEKNNRAVIVFNGGPPESADTSNILDEKRSSELLINGAVTTKKFLYNSDELWRVSTDGLVQSLIAGNWHTVTATKGFMDAYSKNWENLQYSVYPAPFALILSLILGGIAIVMFLLPPESKISENSFLEDFFVNDAPISSPETDKLNFSPIAQSLSEFLRNERTSPPLTVAVTGQWGSGKSSLMQLLKSELSEHRLNPVWINAWHHQNESQFLSGLLERIREDALPPTFTSANIIFQLNLIWLRFQRQPIKNILLFAPIFLISGLLIANNGEIPIKLLSWLDVDDKQKGISSSSGVVAAGYSLFAILSILGTKISSITGNSWFKRVLGLRPKSLDLRSMIGLREQFVSEFQNICKALEPTTLTIFIDDLDRCNEKRILDILESVNFLVSSGNCFVVLGMEKEPIEKAIANYYRRTHQGMNEDELTLKSKRYLEKLINIEVPVPETSSKQSQSLTKASKVASQKRDWTLIFKHITQIFLISFLFMWAGVALHDNFLSTSSDDNDSKSSLPTVIEQELETLPREDEEIPPVVTDRNSSSVNSLKSKQAQEHESNSVWWLFSFIILFAVFIVYEKFRQRKNVVVTDSRNFEINIEKWGVAVGDTRPTPRKIKRFINRTRFLAMRSKNSEQELKEDEIITLAALHEIAPELFDEIGFKSPNEIISKLSATCQPEHISEVKENIMQYCSEGRSENIELFKRWIKGIALRS